MDSARADQSDNRDRHDRVAIGHPSPSRAVSNFQLRCFFIVGS